jgi:hypothetical protein
MWSKALNAADIDDSNFPRARVTSCTKLPPLTELPIKQN